MSTFKDDLTRRHILSLAAKSCLGVSFVPAFDALTTSKVVAAPAANRKAEHVIYLFMTGAMSHLDTFDPKPKSDVKGETKTIDTAVPGMQFSEFLPELAKRAKELAVVRSLYTETGDHDKGRYLMRTAYKENSTIRHPAMGAWLHHHRGSLNPRLPASVTIGGGGRHPAAGFLPTKFTPVPVGNPNSGLQNTIPPKYLDNSRFNDRMGLINKFDQDFRAKYDIKPVKTYTDFYEETVKLLKSEDLKTFDLDAESSETRDAYGRNTLGQGCLLARRLVENDVRFVEVAYGNWDHHNQLWDNIPERAAALDQALSRLLDDLRSKGLLEKTLVVVASEFGRKPKINQNAGRDHHPGVFSGVLAGGGIKGGTVYGSSDEDGHSPEDNPVSIEDFNATIAETLGLPLKEEVFSDSGRPFKVGNDGEPLPLR